MSHNFIDTSAVLNGAIFELENCAISALTLIELESIKSAKNKDDKIQYQAREALRTLATTQNVWVLTHSLKDIQKLKKKYSFLYDINDHNIICEAELQAREDGEIFHFYTSDRSQYLFASRMPNLRAYFYEPTPASETDEYCGWGKYYPNEEQMALLYSNPELNILDALTNEYCEIYEGNELKDVLRWDGHRYRNLKFNNFKSVFGERIQPRNLEQKMYLDLLQNRDIPIKLCTAPFGTGKSYLALSYALNEIQKGNFDKIVFVKNNLEVKGAGRLGTLPGTEIEKQMPWLRQIEDHIGPQLFEEYLTEGIIEPAHLSSLRGRDLKNSCIIVDEAENLLVSNIQLLLGRVSSGSEIIFCADVKQCDYNDKSMSGIPFMIERLKGDELFGMVKLIKSERSAVAAKADLLD